MDITFRDKFSGLWAKYFDGAPLPMVFFYTDDEAYARFCRPAPPHACIMDQLNVVREGETLTFTADTIACGGGKKYAGFTTELRANFEYFLSRGIPGKLEGERYKKTPELVRQMLDAAPRFDAPGKYLVFRRWDRLEAADGADVVVFIDRPDVLSGIFTLANFDQADPNGVFSPFGAGCGTIIQYPYMEAEGERPRAVLGIFDVSARPCVDAGSLSIAMPMVKFASMAGDMEESFLITSSWSAVRRRIEKANKAEKAG